MRSAPLPSEQAQPIVIAPWRGDLEALASTWSALADSAHPGAPFRSWAWLSSWWKTFSAGKELVVLVAHQEGRSVGLLPLFSTPSRLGGRRLAFLGEGIVGSDYLGLVCAAAAEPALADAFADYLERAPYDELDLDGLLPDDPLLDAVTRQLATDRVAQSPRYRCPHITLAGDFESYLKGLPDGTGQQWKRRLRWLEKQPGFALETLSTPADLDRGLTTLFALHHRRWAVEGGSEAIDGPDVEAFHRHAGRALAEVGWARLYLLNVEGETRAALYGFRHGDRFAFYQAGYDPDWRQRSVGTVLLGQVVERCFAEGVAEYDFLRGCEPYKLKWANGERQTVRLRARDSSLRARLHDTGRSWYWRLREASKRALPPETLEWARRTRARVFR
jgi:CelD/BcsL family acetyltransferase involved in cellulose biosynthesis